MFKCWWRKESSKVRDGILGGVMCVLEVLSLAVRFPIVCNPGWCYLAVCRCSVPLRPVGSRVGP